MTFLYLYFLDIFSQPHFFFSNIFMTLQTFFHDLFLFLNLSKRGGIRSKYSNSQVQFLIKLKREQIFKQKLLKIMYLYMPSFSSSTFFLLLCYASRGCFLFLDLLFSYRQRPFRFQSTDTRSLRMSNLNCSLANLVPCY
jgi:hypothetical protein